MYACRYMYSLVSVYMAYIFLTIPLICTRNVFHILCICVFTTLYFCSSVNKIDEETFIELTESDIRGMEITIMGIIKRLKRLQKTLKV